MKLINKKTGEVIDLDVANIKAQFGGISVIPEPVKLGGDEYVYHSLSELNDEWEDYEPAEPLIKDEKIRKAVRAWAEANEVLEVFIDRIGDGTYIELYDEDDGRRRISALRPTGLKIGEAYTIDELCGEEEE